MASSLQIKTPGRICLFGDHQDYLGLPVIACAIDRFVFLSSELNATSNFRLRMPDIGEERIIPISETFDTLKQGDHLASTLRVVRRYGCVPDRGFDIKITSNLPINAGVSSSSAVVVAWTHFLLTAFGCSQKVTSELIARIAYEAEVVEHQSPGGNMDQYTAAVGDILYIETGEEFSFLKLGTELEGLVLGVSGIPKQTIGLLGDLRGKAQTAISEIKKKQPKFDLKSAVVNDIPSLSDHLQPQLQPYFEAAVRNHVITQQALTEFRKDTPDLATIGDLMSQHHGVLKNLLKITVPRIDTMIEAAMATGAYGAKIVGSGGGGSIVALAPPGKDQIIKNAILNAGAIDAYKVHVSGGTKATNP